MFGSERSASIELVQTDNHLPIKETHLEGTYDDDDREQAEHAPSSPSAPPPEMRSLRLGPSLLCLRLADEAVLADLGDERPALGRKVDLAQRLDRELCLLRVLQAREHAWVSTQPSRSEPMPRPCGAD